MAAAWLTHALRASSPRAARSSVLIHVSELDRHSGHVRLIDLARDAPPAGHPAGPSCDGPALALVRRALTFASRRAFEFRPMRRPPYFLVRWARTPRRRVRQVLLPGWNSSHFISDN